MPHTPNKASFPRPRGSSVAAFRLASTLGFSLDQKLDLVGVLRHGSPLFEIPRKLGMTKENPLTHSPIHPSTHLPIDLLT